MEGRHKGCKEKLAILLFFVQCLIVKGRLVYRLAQGFKWTMDLDLPWSVQVETPLAINVSFRVTFEKLKHVKAWLKPYFA